MVTLYWFINGKKQEALFASLDEAKTCEQELIAGGFTAGYVVPNNYREPHPEKLPRTGLLSDEEVKALTAKISRMSCVSC